MTKIVHMTKPNKAGLHDLRRYVERNKILYENAKLEDKIHARLEAQGSQQEETVSSGDGAIDKRTQHIVSSKQAILMQQSSELRDLQSKLRLAQVNWELAQQLVERKKRDEQQSQQEAARTAAERAAQEAGERKAREEALEAEKRRQREANDIRDDLARRQANKAQLQQERAAQEQNLIQEVQRAIEREKRAEAAAKKVQHEALQAAAKENHKLSKVHRQRELEARAAEDARIAAYQRARHQNQLNILRSHENKLVEREQRAAKLWMKMEQQRMEQEKREEELRQLYRQRLEADANLREATERRAREEAESSVQSTNMKLIQENRSREDQRRQEAEVYALEIRQRVAREEMAEAQKRAEKKAQVLRNYGPTNADRRISTSKVDVENVPCSTLPGKWRLEDVAAARKALLSKARHLIPYLPPHTLNPDEADWLIKTSDPSSNQH